MNKLKEHSTVKADTFSKVRLRNPRIADHGYGLAFPVRVGGVLYSIGSTNILMCKTRRSARPEARCRLVHFGAARHQ